MVSSVGVIVFLFVANTFPTNNEIAGVLIMLGLSVYFKKNIFKSHIIKKQILNIYDRVFFFCMKKIKNVFLP